MTTARVAGSLFLTATVAGVLSAVLLGTGNSTPSIAGDAHRISAGALMILVMAAAIAMIPPTLFPVLRELGEAPALGYVAARIIEVVLLLPAAVMPLMLVSTPSETVRALSRTYEVWGQSCSAFFFCLGSLLLNYLLFRSRLVPRWIAGWALVAAVPYLADVFLVMFGMLSPASAAHALLFAPLALNEVVLAGWLLTKGWALP